MNNQDFYKLTDSFYQQCVKVMQTKGQEYSGSEDKFANFKRLAELQGIPVTAIWYTYFIKHFDSLTSFIRQVNAGQSVTEIESKLSEPISGRITDMVNYLLILNGMLEERKELGEIIERGNSCDSRRSS